MSFVLGDNSSVYVCIDGFFTSVVDFDHMKADFTLVCSVNGCSKLPQTQAFSVTLLPRIMLHKFTSSAYQAEEKITV